jgi:hypothetical protein
MRLQVALVASGFFLAVLTTSDAGVEDAPDDYQSLVVPGYSVNFDRGSYEIISARKYSNEEMLTDKELINILEQAGFSGNALKYAWAIAVKESTKRPMALNKSSNCYGLFQINMTGSMGPDRRERYDLNSNEDLFNPLINAQVAYKMSNGGKNWSAWTTYRSASKLVSSFPG